MKFQEWTNMPTAIEQLEKERHQIISEMIEINSKRLKLKALPVALEDEGAFLWYIEGECANMTSDLKQMAARVVEINNIIVSL